MDLFDRRANKPQRLMGLANITRQMSNGHQSHIFPCSLRPMTSLSLSLAALHSEFIVKATPFGGGKSTDQQLSNSVFHVIC